MAAKKRKASRPRKPSKSVGSSRRAPKRPSKPPAASDRFQALRGVKKALGVQKPLWSLSDGITYSSLSTWEQCQEQFGLKYIDGYTAKAISIPLEFGNLIHWSLECQLRFPDPKAAVAHVTNKYRTWRSKTLVSSKDRDTLEFLCGLAEVTFPGYARYWEKDDAAVDWIGREEKFDVPYTLLLPISSDGMIEGIGIKEERTIRLRGMRDGLFRIKGPKGSVTQPTLGLFETKTKSRISESEISSGLLADMQTLFYCFVTWLETGEFPKKIKYNIIRRTDVYRRDKGKESLPQYLRRVKEDVESRPDHYFSRFGVDLLQRDILNFQKYTLDPLLRRFIVWSDGVKKNPLARFSYPLHSRNLSSLIGKYGKSDVWELIVNQNKRPYRIRKEVFPELEDSFLATA